MNTRKGLIQAIDSINEWVGKGLRYLILLVLAIIFFEVVARYVFNRPTLWGMLSATWLWGGLSVLSAGYVLKNRAHVRMDIVYSRVPNRWRAALDVFNSLFFFFFVCVLIWAGWKYGWRSIKTLEHYGEVWNPPIYPVKITIFLGACLLLLQGLAQFIRDLTLAITGKELDS